MGWRAGRSGFAVAALLAGAAAPVATAIAPRKAVRPFGDGGLAELKP